ncbi:MAG: ABC transporter permease [Armatimonadota bacterium]|nr:ABC transporter permease [Armatimonadota bacterium]MDR7423312.1 ABC transporter permease [Armatimonadota bacterium]MDR7457952.1 ABC transporter permease [Armatimonadota bacterium]MDR7495900.1 ABC transporter permease [Armatimonadota bacterium]MDR7511851.1 ABC transporter permease [Armatimonadota bacterium]
MHAQSPGRFVVTRIRDGLGILLLVTVVIFLLGYGLGDPAALMSPVDATPEEIENLRRLLGLDRPLYVQFVDYFGHLLRGDFGESLWQYRPALPIVLEALPFTLLLTATALVLAGLLGGINGTLAGFWAGSRFDRATNFLTVAAVSVPSFWVGLILIAVAAVRIQLFPTSGFTGWQSLVLPAVTLAVVHGGRIHLLVRSATFEEMTKPYAMVARSKGLPDRLILWKHVLRNTSVTVATTIGWEYVRMLGGAAFAVEVVFAWPGIGQLMINAANRHDFPVLQCAVIIAGAFVVATNALVDIGYRLMDARLRVA